MAAVAQFAPRGAVQRKSGTLDFPDGYSRQMVRWRDQLMRQAQEEMQYYADFQEAERYIDYLNGNWWKRDRPSYRSRFYDNYLADQRREALSALTDIRPQLDISCKVKAYDEQVTGVDNYMRYLWFEEDLDLTIVDWVDHALFGTGFIKNVAYEPGEFLFSTHGLDSVTPVSMNANKLQTAAAVIYHCPQTVSHFQQKFGTEKCIGLERMAMSLSSRLGQERYTRPDSIPEYTWNSMSPQLRRRLAMIRNGPTRMASGSYSPIPIVELQEIYYDDPEINEDGYEKLVKHPDLSIDEHNYHYIVPPKCRLYPRKRLIVFAGDRVMYDGPSPYWHGLYPFSMLQLNPCVWSPGGIAKYRDLVPLVYSLNRVGAGIDEAVMRALNGTWVGRRGAIPDAVWDAFQPGKPGQKILLNPVANTQTDFREMTAPQLPGQVEMWARYLVDTIKRRSGALDVAGLSSKKQVPGGDTLAQMSDAKGSVFRLEGRYLEAALRDAGKQTVSNIFQYATADQRLRVLGADGLTWSDEDWYAGRMVPHSEIREDFWKKFSVRIAPGSSHGNARYQKKVEAFTMHGRGALSTEGLYEQTEFPAKWEVEKKRLAQEHAQGIGIPPAKGKEKPMKRSQRNGSPV